MKIEKLNDNQIRCTLTPADLADRHLKLSELAYGTEKAKALFRDMMQQASFDFGFEADDLPLMIEAIPASSDSLVLIITKVEDPEELDTRFSRFTSLADTETPVTDVFDKLEGADEFMNLLGRVKEAVADSHAAAQKAQEIKEHEETESKSSDSKSPLRLFSFANIDSVIRAAHMLAPFFKGESILYKDPANDVYIMALIQSQLTHADFNRVCNMLAEYSTAEKATGTAMAYLEEHCETIVPSHTIENLATV